MSTILPSCTEVWGTPVSWAPVGIKHGIISSGTHEKYQVKNPRQPVSGKSKELNQLFWLTVLKYNILILPKSCLRHGTVFQI